MLAIETMEVHRLVDPISLAPHPPRPPFPGLARLGLALMAFGLVLDLVEHEFVSHVDDPIVAGFPLSEHAAHSVVLVGMVVVLVGIVRAGLRASAIHQKRNRSVHDAVR
jgi:uncharacterized membrane protein YidH (DUF202 family)